MAIKYETLVERIVYDANDKATFFWVELSPEHVPSVTGLIKRISFAGAEDNASGMTTEPVYLGVWERQDDGGLVALGISKAPIVQQLNVDNVWEFDGITCRGRSLLISLLSNPNEHWSNNTSLLIRSRVKTGDSDGCVMLTPNGRHNVTPDITFVVEYAVEVPDEPEEPDTPDVPDEPVIPDEPEEDEVNLRQIDILDYLPPIVRNTDEFKQIAEAENPELNNYMRCTYDVLVNAFIQTAKPYALTRWENLLNLSHSSSDSLDDRRIRIVTHLTLNVPYTWRVLKQMLNEFLGEDTFVMEYINDEMKLIIHTDRLADDKLQTVNELLDKVLPRNIEIVKYNHDISIPWTSWLPGYTQIEYLESTGTQGIFSVVDSTSEDTYEVVFSKADLNPSYSYLMYIHNELRVPFCNESAPDTKEDGKTAISFLMRAPSGTSWPSDAHSSVVSLDADVPYTLKIAKRGFYVNGRLYSTLDSKYVNPIFKCTRVSAPNGKVYSKVYSLQVREENTERILLNNVPALDPTGAPCMIDTVTRTAYYNEGTGDFLYPGKEQEASTFSLRRPVMYAQLTRNGVRRLYHVPDGYNGTREEYAAEHGFKPIVETDMPEEGYWEPKWTETDDEIVLEWIETEAPEQETEQ